MLWRHDMTSQHNKYGGRRVVNMLKKSSCFYWFYRNLNVYGDQNEEQSRGDDYTISSSRKRRDGGE